MVRRKKNSDRFQFLPNIFQVFFLLLPECTRLLPLLWESSVLTLHPHELIVPLPYHSLNSYIPLLTWTRAQRAQSPIKLWLVLHSDRCFENLSVSQWPSSSAHGASVQKTVKPCEVVEKPNYVTPFIKRGTKACILVVYGWFQTKKGTGIAVNRPKTKHFDSVYLPKHLLGENAWH